MTRLRDDLRARCPISKRRRIQLLIEESAAHSKLVRLVPNDCDETIVVREREGESPLELLVRATLRIADLERDGSEVGHAIIALTPLSDPGRTAVRRLLGWSILNHLQALGDESVLVLAVASQAPGTANEDAIALAEVLRQHAGSCHASVRLFISSGKEPSEPPAQSGVHTCATFSPDDRAASRGANAQSLRLVTQGLRSRKPRFRSQ